jgi:serpin B
MKMALRIRSMLWLSLLVMIGLDGARAEAGSAAKELAGANAEFAVQLFRRLGTGEGNLVFSPYSIWASLATARAGARGKTAGQMDRALRLDMVRPNLEKSFRELNEVLRSVGPNNVLAVANSLWPSAKLPLRPEFLQLVERDYGATVTPVDYFAGADAAREQINNWVAKKTQVEDVN